MEYICLGWNDMIDFISIDGIIKVLELSLTFWGISIASRGLSTWREQVIETPKIELAREIMEKRPVPKQYAGLKFFNVYGPNEYHKGGQKSVVAHIFPDVKNDREVKLFKSYNPAYRDGEQLRDFVWVGDTASVILWLLENPQVNGLFNVGTGEARSFYDLAKAVWAAMGKTPKIGFKEMPEELRGKYQYYTKADLTKLRKAGYTAPMTSLEDGVRQYVQQYLNEEDMYK